MKYLGDALERVTGFTEGGGWGVEDGGRVGMGGVALRIKLWPFQFTQLGEGVYDENKPNSVKR